MNKIKNKQLWLKINTLNFKPILLKLLHDREGCGWHVEKLNNAIREYKQFLYLLINHPEFKNIPSKDVDFIWHNHILDTKKYFEDCFFIAGEYIHHHPYMGLKNDLDYENLKIAFSQTTLLSSSIFGNGFSKNEASCSGDSGCSSCKSLSTVNPASCIKTV